MFTELLANQRTKDFQIRLDELLNELLDAVVNDVPG